MVEERKSIEVLWFKDSGLSSGGSGPSGPAFSSYGSCSKPAPPIYHKTYVRKPRYPPQGTQHLCWGCML